MKVKMWECWLTRQSDGKATKKSPAENPNFFLEKRNVWWCNSDLSCSALPPYVLIVSSVVSCFIIFSSGLRYPPNSGVFLCVCSLSSCLFSVCSLLTRTLLVVLRTVWICFHRCPSLLQVNPLYIWIVLIKSLDYFNSRVFAEPQLWNDWLAIRL